jgi:hypothetical protein
MLQPRVWLSYEDVKLEVKKVCSSYGFEAVVKRADKHNEAIQRIEMR